MSKQDVYIVDDTFNIITVAEIRKDHLAEMTTRGWITANDWLVEDETVNVMGYRHMIEYLNEVA